MAKVEYRIDGDDGSWQLAPAQDGAFDSDYEPFSLALGSLEAGTYRVDAFATDATGYVEINIASQEIQVSDVSPLFLPIVIHSR